MFNNSKIDHSNLSNQLPSFDYPTENLKDQGFEFKYALSPKNPVYIEVINELRSQNIDYKIISSENNQEHVWIKRAN